MDRVNEYREWAMDDIVFENRNKAYGSYQIRKLIAHNVLIGLAIAVLGFVMVITPFSIDWDLRGKVPQAKEKITPVDLTPAAEVILPPPPPPVIPPPVNLPSATKFILPPPAPPPLVRPSVQYTEMVAKEDEKMHEYEDLSKVEELKEKQISTVTNVGDTSVKVVVRDTPPTVVKEVPVVDTPVYESVDQRPEFPGGDAALSNFIQSNIRYPDMERSKGMEGEVLVVFVVKEDGSMSDAKVLFGVSPGFDKEALRVVKMLPRFRPGRLQGRAVRVYFHIPVYFDLKLL